MMSHDPKAFPARSVGLLAIAVVGAFHLAQSVAGAGWALLGVSAGLCALAQMRPARPTFYVGLMLGLGWYAPQTLFLSTIFGPASLALWLVLALWPALFLVLLRWCGRRWGSVGTVVAAPVLWIGLEYFRCEVYWLRFTWLSFGIPFETMPGFLRTWGVYGAGFLTMLLGAVLWRAMVAGFEVVVAAPAIRLLAARSLVRWTMAGLGVVGVAAVGCWSRPPLIEPSGGVPVAGIQMEFPGEPEVVAGLEKARQLRPEASLFVLSEYTFDEGVPRSVRAWCRKHGRWLIAGGREWVAADPGPEGPSSDVRPLTAARNGEKGRPFRNTALVVSTNGEVVFKQVKSVPIQFFQDGLPATAREVWESPWGRIAIAVCYDLSYRRVMDEFVRLGAQAIIVPAMDVEQWGSREHELNARMARVRSAEYGVEIFRVTSSGVSQLTDASGRERERAGFPGREVVLGGQLRMNAAATIPFDSRLAPAVPVLVGFLLAYMIVSRGKSRETPASVVRAAGLAATVGNASR